MQSYMIPFAVRDALLCLIFLVGIGAGVFAITRNRTKAGGFVIAGFLLMGVDPVLDFLLFNFVSPSMPDSSEMFNWIYACGSGIASIIGVLLILSAFYFAIQPQNNNDEDIVYTQNKL